MGALIAIVAILAWAAVTISKGGSKGGEDSKRLIKALAAQLDEATDERERLQERVENLEAIVTSEHYELEQQAQAAGLSRIDPALLESDPLTDEQEVERLATRAREQ